ncbi:N-acetylmannosamine-6-phosphate 2-epimerase [Tetragenococcus halophilus]|uniref:N-acetylmannosamine-6-phosphate 2-epimerase n=1 Tax=Tetragenococcus halophilus TaxID=51669 RepID=UPI001F3A7D23|nr:N-acetylmannosamine-6-phosphate 2-epimerase [Tetragenococcus halophilus]MDN6140044.1 N-acetylmannosamine-6-phosphate 2-epimerase [Tetragenococcus koreensis]MDN6630158.1 N-acetylmannosamine-6-phosphate 2-epimerase [Staphylococcus equorum]MCF1675287.1 N-acetylmannosamine-6-phosphate 2-epimerase [Tetragenococcus halophilus]MDN6146769.1 N-acetylmannosamine-6-phosphate 2-epimerase [Tetragenococcus koreensis]MDN6166227.1 N-acetylmannosamine-6-phosphate 2-epimerase [Tetragenococcus koreensis]
MKQKNVANFEKVAGELIVSCQALNEEPLHSSFIMSKMALAARKGGAKGIRANSVEDIKCIREEVDLPIIGIIKRDYEDSEVYITPTITEIDELMEVNPEVIALDASINVRPKGESLEILMKEIKEKYPHQLLMADCSTINEAEMAEKLDFDFIGTTMVGYTKQSKGDKIESNDFYILREIIKHTTKPVIAEGNINTPKKAKRVLDLGAYSVVVGSSITRPQIITQNFVDEIKL